MAAWTNRAVYQLGRNSTFTHTVDPTLATGLVSGAAFTPTAGRLLVVIPEGAVTSTKPEGWTQPSGGAAINNTGLYVWHCVAVGGSNAFTTTHNGPNYPIVVAVYEFPAGSTFVGAVSAVNVAAASANPNLTGLTGANLVMATKATPENGAVGSDDYVWTGTGSPVEDWQAGADGGPTDGYLASLAYVEVYTGASWQPTGSLSWTTGPGNEALTFAVKVSSGGSSFPVTGTVVSASAVSGAVTARRPITGTVASTSVTVGAVTARLVVTGTVPASTTAAGTVTVTRAVSGAVASPTGVAGELTSRLPATGVTQAATGVTGALTARMPVEGTVTAVTTVTGALDADGGLSGTVTATTTVAGAVTARRPVTGTVTASSTVSGDLGGFGLTGTIQSTTATAGAVTARLTTTGAVSGSSGIVGIITARLIVAGLVTAHTAIVGNLTTGGPVDVPTVTTLTGHWSTTLTGVDVARTLVGHPVNRTLEDA